MKTKLTVFFQVKFNIPESLKSATRGNSADCPPGRRMCPTKTRKNAPKLAVPCPTFASNVLHFGLDTRIRSIELGAHKYPVREARRVFEISIPETAHKDSNKISLGWIAHPACPWC